MPDWLTILLAVILIIVLILIPIIDWRRRK
nr:MAG TPA: transmembrane domain protein [Caudoviricetes sp.]